MTNYPRFIISLCITITCVTLKPPEAKPEFLQDESSVKPIHYRVKPNQQLFDRSRRFIANEIIVKFNEPTSKRLAEKFSKDNNQKLRNLGNEWGVLARPYRIRNMTKVFPGFNNEKKLKKKSYRIPPNDHKSELNRIFKLEFDLEPGQFIEDVLWVYRQDPDVEYAELNFVVAADIIPTDILYPYQWALNNIRQDYPSSGLYNLPPGRFDSDIDAPEAWPLHTGSSEIIYAVIDTGIDYRHRDLVNNIWINLYEQNGTPGIDDDGNGYVDDIYGYDFINEDANPIDDNGHGTHCAGIIAAEGNNALDIAGVCWDGQIMGLKFLGRDGWGSTTDAVEAIYYAVNNGADIISSSWGSGSNSETLRQAINFAHSQGVIIVASAGNDKTDIPQYPASYDHVIAVAATDSNDKVAQFSNHGDWVDLAAPGVDILSLRAANTFFGFPYTIETTVASGASMACPHVVGACGLLLTTNPLLNSEQINTILMQSGDPTTPGMSFSDKRLNVTNALLRAFSSFGVISFDREIYPCGDFITIMMADADLAGHGFQYVTLSSNNNDREIVRLNEVIPGIGLFSQSILMVSNVPVRYDGVLQTSHSAMIKVIYNDLFDGTGEPSVKIDTAQVDCVSPVISNIQFQIPGPEPVISFQTDEPTQVSIKAGTMRSMPNDIIRYRIFPDTSHTFNLKGVTPLTDYYLIIEAIDEAGNKTIGDNNGACYSFTTTGPGDVHVPADYTTIQEAILRSWDGGVVRVADGTYSGNGNRDIDFFKRAITVKSENGPTYCIIDCQGSESDPHRGFLFHRGEKYQTELNGFTIMNGYARYQSGGALQCIQSSPTISECHFKNNYADRAGGGISGLESRSIIIDCVFNNNQAPVGGAISGDTLINIRNCHFTENRAAYGGGIFLYHSHTMIHNCFFSQNMATEFGGAILCETSSPTIDHCIISENTSLNKGGGIYGWLNGEPQIRNSIICANRAADKGGGLRFTFSNRPTIHHCTIVSNIAAWGGGIHCANGSNAQIINSILWNNSTEEIAYNDVDLTVTYTNVPGGWSGLGNIDVEPLFVQPGYWAANNTPNDPNDDIWILGDYHLQSRGWRWDDQQATWAWDNLTSRCIDAGNPGFSLADEPVSVMENYPNKWSKNIRINLGAYGGTTEASLPLPDWYLLADLNNDGIVNLEDFTHQSRFWLTKDSISPGDLSRDGITNVSDLYLLYGEWLKETPWRIP